jgi:hypothetical protein
MTLLTFSMRLCLANIIGPEPKLVHKDGNSSEDLYNFSMKIERGIKLHFHLTIHS